MTDIDELDKLVADAPPDQVPYILGRLEQAKAMAWARLMALGPTPAAAADADELMTMEKAADYLKIDVETARAMGRAGTLPTVKLGERSVRVRIGALRNWVRYQERGK
jgi:excisionase family DNA binding protein